MKRSMTKKGFSLVEVIISVAILTLGLSAITLLMVNSLTSLNASKNEIIAANLAQEGAELVRNLHDNNPDFRAETDEKPDGNDYRIDVDTNYNNFMSNTGSNKRLKARLVGGQSEWIYKYDGTINTKFYRKIILDNVNDVDNKYINVYSMVIWDSSGTFRELPDCTVANKCVYVYSQLTD